MLDQILNFASSVSLWDLLFDVMLYVLPLVLTIIGIVMLFGFISIAYKVSPASLVLSLIAAWILAGQVHDHPAFQNHSSRMFIAFEVSIAASILFGIGVIHMLVSRRRGGKSGSAKALNSKPDEESNSLSDLYLSRKPLVKFDDVYGMAALKAQLIAAVEKHRTDKKNGILLSGDPGNGKTLIAEALAGQLGWGFMPITISDIQSRWIGQTTEQMKAVFDAAAKHAPIVLFLDECDSMLRDRSSMMGGGNDESLKVVNTFLTGVVNIRLAKNVIVIAATNYPDQLDSAVIRDGRFDFKIEVPAPDREARRGLLLKFAKNVTFDEGVLDRLVKRWEGFSVVRIRNVAERIADNAKAQGKQTVSTKEAMVALRSTQGSLGESLPENTPGLQDMHFDESERKKLMSLAKRMENIEDVERMGGQVPRGILFFGPPGTGKTAVAKALAMTSGWAFLSTSGNDLLSNPESFAKLLNKARDLRPCIVFIDEADDVLMDRGSNPFGATATNRILSEMDGTKQLNDVMFIAATNHPEALDGAAVRGGRFSERYEFKKPEESTVLLMVKEWINEKRSTTPFHAEFSPEAVAVRLEGLAPADIKDKLQQAVNAGVGRMISEGGAEQVMLSDLQAVL